MKTGAALSLAGLALTLQSAVLTYVVRIEHRLTRVETLIDPRLARGPIKAPPRTQTTQQGI